MQIECIYAGLPSSIFMNSSLDAQIVEVYMSRSSHSPWLPPSLRKQSSLKTSLHRFHCRPHSRSRYHGNNMQMVIHNRSMGENRRRKRRNQHWSSLGANCCKQ
ncbi:hypothetical protein WG66_010686 [Moniliophthora roreri]|nr:hypothetical protein WG66_010686 [Moniliophthora roreri]